MTYTDYPTTNNVQFMYMSTTAYKGSLIPSGTHRLSCAKRF